jgi:hypothetical protein
LLNEQHHVLAVHHLDSVVPHLDLVVLHLDLAVLPHVLVDVLLL